MGGKFDPSTGLTDFLGRKDPDLTTSSNSAFFTKNHPPQELINQTKTTFGWANRSIDSVTTSFVEWWSNTFEGSD
jgi:hypothetical protein